MSTPRGDDRGLPGVVSSRSRPDPRVLRWLIALRLVVITTLFLGSMIVQVTSRMILPLQGIYLLSLLTYVLSLGYTALYLLKVPVRLQAILQTIGDVAVVSGFVYVTGGLYSPFSFLYLAVIAVASLLYPRGGLLAAGLASMAYGGMVDLMVFGLVPIPPNLVGTRVSMPMSGVLVQLFINILGFLVVAILTAYLAESVSRMAGRLAAERQRSQHAEALAEHVLRSVTSGMLALDGTGTVLQANPAAAHLLGEESPDVLVGREIKDVLPLERYRWELLLGRARMRNVSRLEDTTARSGLAVGLTVGPLTDETGNRAGFVVSFQDLSEVRREEERQRMQERMAAIGEMSARMAHEIRNPLASISGAAQLLSTSRGPDDTARRLLDIVVRESRRLSEILQGFLLFAKPGELRLEKIRLASIARDCADLLAVSPEVRSDHRIEIDVPEELAVTGEENALRQIFWNLCRNAIQAMPDGGTLRILARRESNGEVVLRFTDEGSGFPEEILERAFEPFVSARPEGTGLGLAVVYAAVARQGAGIEVENAEGGGARVTIRFPAPDTGGANGEADPDRR